MPQDAPGDLSGSPPTKEDGALTPPGSPPAASTIEVPVTGKKSGRKSGRTRSRELQRALGAGSPPMPTLQIRVGSIRFEAPSEVESWPLLGGPLGKDVIAEDFKPFDFATSQADSIDVLW